MWRNSDDEEYAIDAAIPSLTSLETLVLDGDLSSEKALIRKVRQRPRDEDTTRTMHRISLRNPLVIRLEKVLDALSVTGWDSICVYLDTPVGYSPRSSADVAQAAMERGIDFRVFLSPRELESDDVS